MLGDNIETGYINTLFEEIRVIRNIPVFLVERKELKD